MNAADRYFEQAIAEGRLSHAYLLEMKDRQERMRTARGAAQRLLCEKGTACGVCAACRAVLRGSHPDVIYVKHEKPDLMTIREVREQLVSDIGIRPYRSAYKIYIVDDAGKMNPQAQNAILKTLEDPPRYGVILLLSDSRSRFLPTVLSRVVTLCPDAEDAEDEAENAGRGQLLGYLRRAQDLPVTEMAGIAAACRGGGLEPAALLDVLTDYWRDVLLLYSGADIRRNYPEEEPAQKRFAEAIPAPALNALWRDIGEAKKRLASNGNPENILEIFFLHLQAAMSGKRESEP